METNLNELVTTVDHVTLGKHAKHSRLQARYETCMLGVVFLLTGSTHNIRGVVHSTSSTHRKQLLHQLWDHSEAELQPR